MRRRLLLADDSMTIQRVIELTFSGQDVDVITVNDGDQAIARIPVEKPDIVLADIGMSGRSGYEVCAFVKERPDLARIPVLLLAGAFEPVDEGRVRQVRGDGVLVKPFEPQQVIARVRELIDGRPGAPPATAPAVPPIDAAPAPASGLDPEPPRPEIGVAGAAPADPSLDQYFDRLDAAFARRGNGLADAAPPPSELDAGEPTAGRPRPPEEEPFVVPTIDELLGGVLRASMPEPAAHPPVMPFAAEPPETPATRAPSPPLVRLGPDGSGRTIADTFSALFAIERGEADPSTARLVAAPEGGEVSEELVDAVSRRVLERLAPGAARAVVADIVSEIAERLVREEIERIRGRR